MGRGLRGGQLVRHKLAVLASREGKHEVPAGRDVVAEWRERAAAVGLDRERIATLLGREWTAERRLDVTDVRQLVGERGLTAEAATFTRRDLVRAVAAHAPLGLPLPELDRIVDATLADRIVGSAPSTRMRPTACPRCSAGT